MKSLYESIFDIDDNIDDIDNSIKKEILEFIKYNYRGSVKISDKPNKEGKYEVVGITDIFLYRDIPYLTNGKFVWSKAEGNFEIEMRPALRSLEGSPRIVEGDFICASTPKIETLEDGPEIVKGSYHCHRNPNLKTLKGAPKKVYTFHCSECQSLTTLKYAPVEVENEFNCNHCHNLYSLKYAPKKAKRFVCFNCGELFYAKDVLAVCKVSGDHEYDIWT